jgi:uncharacterized protein (TIGR04255 family)
LQNRIFQVRTSRMAKLPNFLDPPVDEVFLGLQFEPPAAYSSVHAGEVWALFSRQFPIVSEVPRLEPQFEVFGGNPVASFQFNFGGAPVRNRMWFLSEDQTHLLQFQEDRLFLNWRKRPNGSGPGVPYPRYRQIFATYKKAIMALNKCFSQIFGEPLKVTQAEAAYYNIVFMEDFADVGETFNFLNAKGLNLDGFATTLVETIGGANGQPLARCYYELQSLPTPEGRKIARLALTVRGKPKDDSVAAGLSLIDIARLNIIHRFCDLTTPDAQKKWGRTA